MRKHCLGGLLFLFAASVAHAQYPAYGYSPYGYQPIAPRGYSPYGYGAYYRPAPPTYYAAPPSYAPIDAGSGSGNGAIYYPLANPAIPSAPVEPAPQPPRVRRAGQFEVPPLPAPPVPVERSNPSTLWNRTTTVVSPDSLASGCGPTGCGPTACDYGVCGIACKEPRRKEIMWMSANYVGALIRPMRLAAPLLTTGSVLDPLPGAIDQPSTAVMFGNDTVNFNLTSGFNATIGLYLDRQCRYSLEASAFALMPGSQSASFESDAIGNPLLTRPVFATNFGVNAAFLVSATDIASGKIRFDIASELYGAEMNARCHATWGKYFYCDGLLGVRYIRLAEDLNIVDNVKFLNGNVAPFNGVDYTDVSRQDSFGTVNHFAGAQFGGSVGCHYGWLNCTAFAKVGVGATIQKVNIAGSTTFSNADTSAVATGGVLALSSNIGNFSRTVLGVVPEAGLNVSVNVTEHIRLQLGGSALMWNRVARPGMQYTNNVNSGLAPSAVTFGVVDGPTAPLFRFNDENFWVYTLNLGVELRY